MLTAFKVNNSLGIMNKVILYNKNKYLSQFGGYNTCSSYIPKYAEIPLFQSNVLICTNFCARIWDQGFLVSPLSDTARKAQARQIFVRKLKKKTRQMRQKKSPKQVLQHIFNAQCVTNIYNFVLGNIL